jgi:LysM repeat protein
MKVFHCLYDHLTGLYQVTHYLLLWLGSFLLLTGCNLGIEGSTGPLPLPTAVVPTLAATEIAVATLTATAVPSPTNTPVIVFSDQATPEPPTATPTLAPFVEHTVQEGESLVGIAEQYGTTIEAIAAASFLENPDLVYVGQRLTIPQATAEAGFAFSQSPASPDQPTVIGTSVLGRAIEVYTFGNGPNTMIFVGGHHGGYEWNTTVLAYEVIDFLTANPEMVPTAVTIHIIPAANPDGIYTVTGKTGRFTADDVYVTNTFPARFNAHAVDLNRNWDCEWSADAFWRDQPVNPGSEPFSEIENQLLRTYFTEQEQVAVVVFWHSQATLVSPGSCGEPHQPSIEMATIYAQAANYPLQQFSAYEITGDASNWLAKEGIPSFSVELTTHETTDWERNREGVLALLELFE